MKSSFGLSPSEREESILHQLPQVRLLARRLHKRCPPGVLLEDLESTGTMGLIQAADRYDRRRQLKFKTLAEHRIRGAMLDYLRSLDTLPRGVRRFVRERDKAVVTLERQGDYSAAEEQIAAGMGLSMERYRSLLEVAQRAHAHAAPQISTAVGPYTDTRFRELREAIESLPPIEKSVMLSLRDGYELGEIAEQLAVTPARVSHIKHQAIVRLRTTLGVTSQHEYRSA